MRHVVTPLLFVAASLLCLSGIGPMCFGQPCLGAPLFLAGIALETWGWWRLRHPLRIEVRPERR